MYGLYLHADPDKIPKRIGGVYYGNPVTVT